MAVARVLWAGASAGVAVLTGAFLTYTFLVEPQRIVVDRVRIPVRDWPAGLDGFTLVQISDLHAGVSRRWARHVQRAVAMANELRPDLIVISGDIVDDTAVAPSCADILAALHAPHGVVAVLGNHDYYGSPKRPAAVTRALQAAGITVLRNEVYRIGTPDPLHVIGLDDAYTGHDKLVGALQGLPPRRGARILLSHYPDVVERLAAGACDLVLSGHAHGGQIRLPVLAALARTYHIQTAYAQGLYCVGGTYLYVNRGLGSLFPQGRFLCPPEVTYVTLARA